MTETKISEMNAKDKIMLLNMKIHRLESQLAEIDELIEKRKILSHESFYSIDLRKLIELREGQK